MGVGRFFKQLLGATGAESAADGLNDDELRLLWENHRALSPRQAHLVRDALIARGSMLPFAAVKGPYGASALPGDDDPSALSERAARLGAVDPHIATDDPVRIASVGFMLRDVPGRWVGCVFPTEGWEGVSEVLALVPESDALSTLCVLPSSTGTASLPSQWRSHPGLRDVDIVETDGIGAGDEEIMLGTLTACPLEGDSGIWEIFDAVGEMHVVTGARIPLCALMGGTATTVDADTLPATHIIGGLRVPATEEIRGEINARGWELDDVGRVIMVAALARVPGVRARVTVDLAGGLGLHVRLYGDVGDESPMGEEHDGGDPAGDGAGPSGEPGGVEEVISRVRMMIHAGRLAHANELLATVEPGAEHAWESTYLSGFIAERQQDRDAAMTAYHAAIELMPTAGQPHHQLAMHYAQSGAFDKALHHAESGAACEGEDLFAAANHALILCAMGRQEDAIEVAQLTQNATGSWLGSMVECAVHDLSDPTDAVTVTVFSPEGARSALLTLSLAYLRAGDVDRAFSLIEQDLELCPGRPATVGQWALHLVASGAHEEALKWCDDALTSHPHFIYLRAIRGWIHGVNGRREEAIDDMKQCHGMVPDQLDWAINFALLLIHEEHWDDALEVIAEMESCGADMQLIADLRRRAKG